MFLFPSFNSEKNIVCGFLHDYGKGEIGCHGKNHGCKANQCHIMRVGVTISDMPPPSHAHTHKHTRIQLDEKLTGSPRVTRRNAMSVSGGLTMTARRRSKSGQYCLMSISPDSFPKPYLDQSGYLPHFQPTHLHPFIVIWYGKVVEVVVVVGVGMGSGGDEKRWGRVGWG